MLRKLFFVALVATVAAGCTLDTQESTGTGDDSRSLSVSVPVGTTQLRVDTTATGQAGTPDVTVLVKDDGGTILGAHTFAVTGTTSDTLTVDVNGQSHLTVIAKVVDGAATLDVRVSAIVPGQPDVIVIHQTIVITQTSTVTTTPTTTPTASTPTPTASTPTPTASTPTPSPTPTTPVNNSTNGTG